MIVIFFLYGLSFFLFGFSLLLYPKRERPIGLSSTLWMVGAFGIIHGANEWVDMFIFLNGSSYIPLLKASGLLLLPASFLFLLVFGLRGVIRPSRRSRIVLYALPPLMVLAWALGALASDEPFVTGDILARYLIAVPGISLTAVSLLRHGKYLDDLHEREKPYIAVAAFTFMAYGLLAGLVVPRADFFPASFLNYETFHSVLGFPVQAVRTACAVVIAYSLMRSLRIFSRETKSAIRQSEDMYRAIVENTNDLVMLTRPDGVISYLSPACRAVLGHDPEAILETQPWIIHPDDLQGVQARHRGSLQGESGTHYEYRILTKEGETKWISHSWAPVFRSGRLQQIVSVLRDVTERRGIEEALKKAYDEMETTVEVRTSELTQANALLREEIDARKQVESDLRESERRYRLLFENNPLPMMVYDFETLAILAVNVAAVGHYGYSIDEFLTLTLQDLRPEEDVPLFLDFVTKIDPVLSHSGRWRHRKKDGTVFEAEVTSHAVQLGGRKARSILVNDITERKRLEQEIIKAEKLEALGILAGGLAHDFNNLLAAILGNVSLAKLYAENDERLLDRLNQAERASLRARDLTHQLLTFARGGAPVKKPLVLEELVSDAAGHALRGSNVRLDLRLDDGLWTVEADEGQVRQAVNNIVVNAAQSMPEGGVVTMNCENVTLATGSVPPLVQGRYVRISIRDEGEGISLENAGRIFEPFFTTRHAGAGLGLATSYSIIKNHGGAITVDSTPGKGSLFQVYLPALESAPVPSREETEKSVPGTGRVLVMDDEEIVRETAGSILRHLGYEVVTAADGTEALARYQEAKAAGKEFDAVIMDLTIPGGMGGKEAVRRLRAIDPDARVIVSSGYSNDPVMADFRLHGFAGVVIKPYRIEDLDEALRRCIEKQE